MKSILTFVAVASICVAATGCDGGVSLEQMPSKIATTYCAKVYECCAVGEIDGGTLGPDQATCQTNVQSMQSARRDKIDKAQSAGRIAYHGDRLDQCLSELSQTSCTDMKSVATSRMTICDTFLEGRVDAGSFCTQDEECLNGRCLQSAATDAGACATFVAEGASCAAAPCGDGLYCQSGTAICVVREADGKACTQNGQCAAGGCNANPDGGTTRVCGLKGGPGTTCFATTGCGASGAGAFGPLALLSAAVLLAALARRRPPQGMA